MVRKKEKQQIREILNKFDLKQLKRIYKHYKYSEPSNILIDKGDYIKGIIDKELGLDKIIPFAEKFKIPIDDVIDIKTKSKKTFSKKDEKTSKRTPIPKGLRDQVWLKYLGNKPEGKCYCCESRTIDFTDFQVGHNKSIFKGGKDNIENLRPICGPCNRGMGTKSIEWYKKKYFSKVEAKKPTTKRVVKKKATKTSDKKIPREELKKPPIKELKKYKKIMYKR